MITLGGPPDLKRVLGELEVNGATIIPNLLPPERLELCANEALTLDYVDQPSNYGPREVEQRVASSPLGEGGALACLGDEIEDGFRHFFGPAAFFTPLCFSNRNVQRYPHETIGIGPHQDESPNRNMVVLFALSGEGQFGIYEEKTDASPRLILPVLPNTLLLMRAPGFLDYTAKERPIHGVRNIVGGPDGYRYVLGLRNTVS